MPEIVKHKKTGLLFEVGNVQSLKKAIQWAAGNPEKMEQFGTNARKEFEDKYTAEKNYQMLMAIYQRAVENHNSK